MRAVIVLVLALYVPLTEAQETGLSFLRIGVNARGGALGDAQTASIDNAFATYWNPAGLTRGHRSIAASHRIWLGDIQVYDVAAQFPIGSKVAWGLAITATDSGDLEARTRPGDPDGTFSAQFISAGISYARMIAGIRAGVTAKYLRERIFDTNASGYAFDVGMQLDLLDGRFKLGSGLRNFGRMTALEVERTPLPRLIQGGIAISPLQIVAAFDQAQLLDLRMNIELSHLIDDELSRLHLGCTVTILDLVDLRGGYITHDELRSFTFGLGFFFDKIFADYAYIPFQYGFDGPGHILSILYHL